MISMMMMVTMMKTTIIMIMPIMTYCDIDDDADHDSVNQF